MQWNFTFYPLVTSSLVFVEVLLNIFDYFWKLNSLFSKFCVNCLLIFYFLYCNSCASKDVNGACYCTCSLVALRVPEMHFWFAKTRKTLEFFEMHTCLWPVAQIWFRHKWRKLVTTSLLLLHIGGYSCLRCWNEFFSAVFHALDWSFLVLHIDGNVCNWIPKVIWPRMDWFWGFLLGNGFFRRLRICMDWNLQDLLNFVLFWRHQIFSIFNLKGILVCSSKKAYSF